MPAYSGHAGSATFLRPPNVAGALADRPYTSGVVSWHLRLSVESAGLLLCRTDYGGWATDVPLLKEVFVGGHAADLTVSGYLDSDDSPFDDAKSMLLPDAAAAFGAAHVLCNRARFSLVLDEDAGIPEITCSGRIVAAEITSSVRGVVGYQVRAALDALRMPA